eukprot:scaffold277330_cov36-Tisochrysis_lutea.AAC.1
MARSTCARKEQMKSREEANAHNIHTTKITPRELRWRTVFGRSHATQTAHPREAACWRCSARDALDVVYVRLDPPDFRVLTLTPPTLATPLLIPCWLRAAASARHFACRSPLAVFP